MHTAEQSENPDVLIGPPAAYPCTRPGELSATLLCKSNADLVWVYLRIYPPHVIEMVCFAILLPLQPGLSYRIYVFTLGICM